MSPQLKKANESYIPELEACTSVIRDQAAHVRGKFDGGSFGYDSLGNLKTASGETIDNRNGNLFHYVIEPTLWGAKGDYVKRLSPWPVA